MTHASKKIGHAQIPRRRCSRKVTVGAVPIGGGSPVSVQSMTNTHTRDVDATVKQIRRLEACGCQIVRIAVATREDARALGQIKREVRIPIVADVHFDPALAVAAIEHGADKVRVNPGNMRNRAKLARLAATARERKIPIRIGVNSGSIRTRARGARVDESAKTVELMVEGALAGASFFEKHGCPDLVLSLKSSSVVDTVEAYRAVAKLTDYPLHLGVTAAGPAEIGLVRNAVGIGTLLLAGIGDTIRVSLTGPPEDEVRAGLEILRSVGLRKDGICILSCPTCSRCEIDLAAVVDEVRARLPRTRRPLTVAVMGCVVNGPGEAREADVGIVAGKSDGFLFRADRQPLRVPRAKLVDRLAQAVEELLASPPDGKRA
ncbi:MAG: flavodoxin-dependent (E)-4-hydroxy-3-methylbut-2-enyl-diphosphate synthase [Planctomycetota bacterium]